MGALWLNAWRGWGAGEMIWGWNFQVTLAGMGGRTHSWGLTLMPSFTKRYFRHLGRAFGWGVLGVLGGELLGWGGALGLGWEPGTWQDIMWAGGLLSLRHLIYINIQIKHVWCALLLQLLSLLLLLLFLLVLSNVDLDC